MNTTINVGTEEFIREKLREDFLELSEDQLQDIQEALSPTIEQGIINKIVVTHTGDFQGPLLKELFTTLQRYNRKALTANYEKAIEAYLVTQEGLC